tara:strand:+ start:132 stop:470 length:339 start_codon:yes stop_codon:yes gene_type:complete
MNAMNTLPMELVMNIRTMATDLSHQKACQDILNLNVFPHVTAIGKKFREHYDDGVKSQDYDEDYDEFIEMIFSNENYGMKPDDESIIKMMMVEYDDMVPEFNWNTYKYGEHM